MLEVFDPASTQEELNSKSQSQSQSQSHITTDGQLISKSWYRAHLGLMTRYLLLFDSYGLVLWGLSFLYAAGPRQHSLSWVRVPWDS
jgi:hypothetical protein